MFLTPIRTERPGRALRASPAPAAPAAPPPPPPDGTVATALARVSTPADEEVAAQQRAFNRMLAERAELQREANAVSDLTLAQLKHEDEWLRAAIRLI